MLPRRLLERKRFLALAAMIGSVITASSSLAARAARGGLPTLQNLGRQLAAEEAAGAFTEAGELTQAAIQGAREIIPAAELGNPAIPEGFGKFATEVSFRQACMNASDRLGIVGCEGHAILH